MYWTLDILISFFTGFYRDGLIEMRPVKAATQYARTWLLFDAILAGVDWATLGLAPLLRRAGLASDGVATFKW